MCYRWLGGATSLHQSFQILDLIPEPASGAKWLLGQWVPTSTAYVLRQLGNREHAKHGQGWSFHSLVSYLTTISNTELGTLALFRNKKDLPSTLANISAVQALLLKENDCLMLTTFISKIAG